MGFLTTRETFCNTEVGKFSSSVTSKLIKFLAIGIERKGSFQNFQVVQPHYISKEGYEHGSYKRHDKRQVGLVQS